jgi:hypothetical protein
VRAYHFVKSEFACSSIQLQRLKIARIEELNDPFEFLGADLSDAPLSPALESVKRCLSQSSGMLCFSRCWNNPLMWSHYADGHRGMCLGFDIPEIVDSGATFEMVYCNNRAIIPTDPNALHHDHMRVLMKTKARAWAYESEVRVLTSLNQAEADGNYFKEFGDELRLREVLIGFRCQTSADTINGWLASSGADAIVRHMAPSDSHFEMV